MSNAMKMMAMRGELTLRQLDVWKEVATGKSNAQIALALGLSEATVRTHLRMLYGRIGVRNRTQAAIKWSK